MEFTIELNSMYLCVTDMERAIAFYEALLGHAVDEKDEIFSIFRLKDCRLCLFHNGKVNEPHTWGNNCLPSFQVNSIDILNEKLKRLGSAVVFPVTKIGSSLVLEFMDSEGNQVEAYAPLMKSER